MAAAILAVAGGASWWAAHAPLAWWPAALIAVALLLGAVAIGGRIALVAPLAGGTAFLPMLFWLIEPAGYVGWILLAAVIAAWIAVLLWIIRPWTRSWAIVVVAPVAWTGIETWRGTVPFGGFDWGALGYAHAAGSPLLPAARVTGVSGLTFVTVLIGVLLYLAVRMASQRRWRVAAGAVVAAMVVGVGASLLAPAPPPTTGRTVDVLAVQGNDLYRYAGGLLAEDVAIAERMLALTLASVAAEGEPDLTVWPESSFETDPFDDSALLHPYLIEAADAVGGDLLAGVNVDVGPGRFANTAVLVDVEGRRVDRYLKRRYVPFGEYVPLRRWLSWFPPLRQIPRDGVPGETAQAIQSDAVTVAAVICFETLFEDVLRSNVRAGDVGLIVALTNDASFGRSGVESSQHIAQSQLRAVENGRWVVHAALSGSSALIDPFGRVVERTAVFEQDTIRADIPVVTAGTPYVGAGDIVGTVSQWLVAALLAVQVVASVRRRRDRQG